MDRDEEISRSWHANADRWVAAVRDNAIRSRAAGTDRAIVEAVRRQDPGRVLDVGCGEGWLSRRLAQECDCEVTGVDGSAALVAVAREADPAGDYRTMTYAEIIADPSRLGGSFDLISLNFALLDQEIAPLLRSLAMALQSGGIIVIQTLHPGSGDDGDDDGWRTETFSGFTSGDWNPMPWYYRTLPSWHAEIAAAGLTVTSCRAPADPVTGAPLSIILECAVAT